MKSAEGFFDIWRNGLNPITKTNKIQNIAHSNIKVLTNI